MDKKKELAIFGGTPIRDSYLPYGQQWIDEEDIHAVVNTLKNDFITTGPAIGQFEKAVAEFVGAKYAVAFSSGTAALHGACYAAGVGKGDEVITSAMTFAATSNSILYMGGSPVFADIDPRAYTISPESIKNLLTKNTKAIITVDFTGQPSEYDAIMSLAEEHNLVVIDDAAHALGANYKGEYIGTIADMTMFSFHPVKHITTGEGGMITTNDEALYKKLVDFRSHGIIRDSSKIKEKNKPWYYEMQSLGFNYRMTDLQASLGVSQMKKLPLFLEKRKSYAKNYTSALEHLKEIVTPYQRFESSSSWHLYIIRLKLNKLNGTREEIYKALQAENIGVNVHYIPVYFQPYYQHLGYKKGLCPHTESLYEEVITLPLFPKMTNRDVEDVIAGVKKVISYYAVE
ncbi:UDP-4-amino-4,6-dideoxy-N-acetyl-beta-L-altrosamine transaminase [Halalkalibacillus halophilus]|uniref:UDP-4-amino-4, 6-dideoxy-N-acetyl-beta-L-altrosamine transaminase n=1 Tax=Halalkalibacillus halophilus TaxID=392827 RepID=UPI000410673E|nr:UDP-4-amino-4,6-dideoxy-N-acetyl-beta-L-altrosamine transaminase [Halalkalibacillus halophilus]